MGLAGCATILTWGGPVLLDHELALERLAPLAGSKRAMDQHANSEHDDEQCWIDQVESHAQESKHCEHRLLPRDLLCGLGCSVHGLWRISKRSHGATTSCNHSKVHEGLPPPSSPCPREGLVVCSVVEQLLLVAP